MRPFVRSVALLALFAACIPLVSAACSTPSTGGEFAIYLTRDDVPPSRMEMLSHVELVDEPLISMDDVVAYHVATHEITLTSKAFNRVASLEVPVSGTSFVVCVDRSPIYWGAFWTPLSSLSFDGVTVWQPLGTSGSTTIQIRLGYPWATSDVADDPRNDPAVLAALDEAGKLTGTPSTTDTLPDALKGYELYSWPEDGQWHFTLITGTNRNKTPEEVLADAPLVLEGGWVHIHAVGVDEVAAALSRLPEGEDVFWLPELREDGGAPIMLPSQTIVDAITEHAVRCGVDLHVEPRWPRASRGGFEFRRYHAWFVSAFGAHQWQDARTANRHLPDDRGTYAVPAIATAACSYSSTTAMTSTSSIHSSRAKSFTTRRVVGGNGEVRYSARMSLKTAKSSRFFKKMPSLTTSLNVAPAEASMFFRFSNTCRVCA
jgi:hypothetical protein